MSMAKNVFKSSEITVLTNKAFIDAPKNEQKEAEIAQEVVEYSGPTAEDLRREAEEFRQKWEQQKKRMVLEAQQEAEAIVKEAEKTGAEALSTGEQAGLKLLEEARVEAQTIGEQAQKQAEELEDQTKRKLDDLTKRAREQGRKDGRRQGYEEGKAELKRLIDRFHAVISAAIEKRNSFIGESETQLMNLVLLIVKKVVKVISENQKNVVINNILEALKKLKSRCEVTVRVSLADVEVATEHKQEFVEMIENVQSISVMEDVTVGKGGCIIETDFGQIDARISSQLHEIEERIVELMPIRQQGAG